VYVPPVTQTRCPGAVPVSLILKNEAGGAVVGAVAVNSLTSARGAHRRTGRAWAVARRHWLLVFVVMPLLPAASQASRSKAMAPTASPTLPVQGLVPSDWRARMAPAVRDELYAIYRRHTGATAEQAESWLSSLEAEGRYQQDVFA